MRPSDRGRAGGKKRRRHSTLDCVSNFEIGVDVDDGFDDTDAGFDDAGDVDVSRCDVVVGCATTGG